MSQIASSLTEKLELLSEEQLASVERFITRLHLDETERIHRAAFSSLSEPAFSSVWDNSEDDIYNEL